VDSFAITVCGNGLSYCTALAFQSFLQKRYPLRLPALRLTRSLLGSTHLQESIKWGKYMHQACRSKNRQRVIAAIVVVSLTVGAMASLTAQTREQEREPKQPSSQPQANAVPSGASHQPADVLLDWKKPLIIQTPDDKENTWPIVIPNVVSLLSVI